jgi:hypothetical protein
LTARPVFAGCRERVKRRSEPFSLGELGATGLDSTSHVPKMPQMSKPFKHTYLDVEHHLAAAMARD